MRILHVMPHYYPAVRYGGPIRSVQGLAAATAAMGHDVHVYTTNVDGPGVSNVPLGAPVDLDGVKVWYFPAGLGRRIFRSPAMERAIDNTIAQFDVVHIHYIWVWTSVQAAAAARRYRVPYIIAPRGMLVADLIARKSTWPKRIWLSLFARRDVEEAAAVHVTAESEAQDVRQLGLKPRRIDIVENGIDLPAVAAPGIDGTPSASTQGTAPYVLFLGRINWKKGLDRLIKALERVEGLDLVIAGYDDDGYRRTIEQQIAQAGLERHVRFVGPVEGEAKWDLIRGALCLALTSYHENFGIAVVEAMAAGCPVIVSEEVGLSGTVRSAACGIVCSGEPQDTSAALKQLLASNEQRLAMGQRGRDTARTSFGWQSLAQKMQLLYLQVAVPSRAIVRR